MGLHFVVGLYLARLLRQKVVLQAYRIELICYCHMKISERLAFSRSKYYQDQEYTVR